MTRFHPHIGRTAAVACAAAGLVIAGAATANALPGGVPAIPLNNGQETTGADTGAHGFFSYEIDGAEFCYTLEVQDLSEPVIAAHIHIGDRKEAGPVVLPLPTGTGTDWTISECVTADPALLEAISADPRSYYVNVHTPTFPGGEVRGQLK